MEGRRENRTHPDHLVGRLLGPNRIDSRSSVELLERSREDVSAGKPETGSRQFRAPILLR